MIVDSREHVETWLELEGHVRDLLEQGELLGDYVYREGDEAVLIDPSLLGKRVNDVGMPSQILEPIIEKLEAVRERARHVVPPSADAIQMYLLERLTQRVDQLHEAIQRVEGQL